MSFPFTVFTNSTTAYAEEVMNNFYHIARDDRLPLGGASLDPTNNVFDLGSSDAKWLNTYCNNLHIASSITTTQFIKNIVDTTIDSQTSRIEISGLNGETRNLTMAINYCANTTTADIRMHLNGNSATSDHVTSLVGKSIGYDALLESTTSFNLEYTYFRKDEDNLLYCVIHGKTGVRRVIKGFMINQNLSGSDTSMFSEASFLWENTTDTLTSFVLASTVSNAFKYVRIMIWES